MDVVCQREEELVSAWWKEYAEVSAGPAMSSGALSYNLQIEKETAEEKLRSLSSANDGGAGQNGPGSTHSDFDDDDDEESVGVLVKGGLYEVRMVPTGGKYKYLLTLFQTNCSWSLWTSLNFKCTQDWIDFKLLFP